MANGDRVIPIQVLRCYEDESSRRDIGDRCGFAPDILRLILTESQIVVTNEEGTIIALEEIIGEVGQSSSGSFFCEADFDVAMPDAQFYTVYLGDERIVGFKADDFPIDPMKEVWITFD